MSRYIDAERFDVIAYETKGKEEWTDFDDGVSFMLNKIDNAPTADVVEVVRCKDCVWHNEENKCVNSHCTKSYYGCRVRDMHFCSYGERGSE